MNGGKGGQGSEGGKSGKCGESGKGGKVGEGSEGAEGGEGVGVTRAEMVATKSSWAAKVLHVVFRISDCISVFLTANVNTIQ